MMGDNDKPDRGTAESFMAEMVQELQEWDRQLLSFQEQKTRV